MERDFPDFGVVYKAKLDGRVPVIAFERKGAPLTAHLIFDYGSMDAPTAGAAHLLEHMLVSGTVKYPTKSSIANAFADRGGYRNAFTGKDRLSLACFLSDTEDTPFASEMFSEFVFSSIFDQETLDKEKTAIADEIRRAKSDFGRETRDRIYEHRYPESTLGRPVLGEIEEVMASPRESLISLLNDGVLKSRAMLAVSGDIGVFEKALSIAKDIEKKLPPVSGVERTVIPSITGEKRFSTINPASSVSISYTTDVGKNSLAALTFANWKMLRQSGILLRKLRFERGLTYSVSGVGSNNPMFSFMGATTTCAAEKIDEVSSIISTSFEKTLFEETTAEELQKCVDFNRKSRRRELETGSSWLGYANNLLNDGPDAPFPEDVDRQILELGAEGIKVELAKYFSVDNRTVTIVTK